MTNNRNIVSYMIFVFFSNLSLLTPFLPLFFGVRGFSLSNIALFFLLYQGTKFIFEVPTGYVADRFGGKISAMLGVALLMISLLIVMMAYSSIVVVVAFFIKGLGYTLISGSVEAIYVNSVDEKKLERLNVVERLVFYSSLALAAYLGGFVSENLGYTTLIMLDMAALGITFISILAIKENPSHQEVYQLHEKTSVQSIVQLLKTNRLLLAFYLIDFANAFSYVGVEDFYSLFLSGLGAENQIIGVFIAVQYVFAALIAFLLPSIRKHLSRKTILFFFPILRIAVSLLIYLGNLPVVLVPILYFTSMSLFSLYAPIKYRLFQGAIPKNIRATALSIQSLMISIGAILFFALSSIMAKVFTLPILLSLALIVTLVVNLIAIGIIKQEGCVE